MDLNNQNNSSIGESEDKISGLPDALIYHILSFLDIKLVVRTSVLSTRWNDIWASIPILIFPSWTSEVSLSEINKFMDFVDRTLLLRDPSSNIQKNYSPNKYGLQDYNLKIYARDLVSLLYNNVVAKDYDLSNFLKLDNAEIYFRVYDDRIGHGAAVSKFLRALSHVQSLIIDTADLQDVLYAEDFVNILPRFNNLNKLDLTLGPASDELIFALLKAPPNLKKLQFDWDLFDLDNDDRVYDETDDLFRHIRSVRFRRFEWEGGELRWGKLIMKTEQSLHKMTIRTGNCD
ncbi:FBD-associated F-box protein At5g22730-like [Papaver somniferum]|uniref:FBD-associated F-box protein At5g22730-like n=1 Tax=Papaver somniferum TaxID=3469 RepID=UPI000E6F667A|nr:FBD-associated F-box protein At5g22730-like [Papaver somniferum]